MAADAERLELEGYLTAVSDASGLGRELYLHAAEPPIFRVVFDATTRFASAADPLSLPIGPAHRVRVRGRVEGDPRLPTLRAERVEELRTAPGGEF